MKKWIQFILMILGVSFIASLTLNFVKAKKKETTVDEGKNYNHQIKLKQYIVFQDEGFPETHFDIADIIVNIVTESADEFTLLSLSNYIDSNVKTETHTYNIGGELETQTETYYILPATGTVFFAEDDSADICGIAYWPGDGIFALSWDCPQNNIDAYGGFWATALDTVIPHYLEITDTVTRTNNELTQSMTIEDFTALNPNNNNSDDIIIMP